jgi:TDG/mug DNA glycosylase family protein
MTARYPKLPDRVASGLRVLFVGINPGVRSAQLGHHFAGVSNRFWVLLRDVGLVPPGFGFADDARLPELGLGITNLVARTTPGVADLEPAEYVAGRLVLLRKVRRLEPRIVALVGVTVARAVDPKARTARIALGLQTATLHDAHVFVLPNPSGRNAHYSYAAMRAAFATLAAAARPEIGPGAGVTSRPQRGLADGRGSEVASPPSHPRPSARRRGDS